MTSSGIELKKLHGVISDLDYYRQETIKSYMKQ